MPDTYRCTLCRAKLAGASNHQRYRCNNPACGKTYCYACCKTGLVFTDTTCPQCGAPATHFAAFEGAHHPTGAHSPAGQNLPVEDDSEALDIDFDLVFCQACDEHDSKNHRAALRKFKEAAELADNDEDMRICYGMIGTIYEKAMGDFDDLLQALKYFRWAEQLLDFLRVLNKLKAHKQVVYHRDGLIKQIQAFKTIATQAEDQAILARHLRELQPTHATSRPPHLEASAQAKAPDTPTGFLTRDARLLDYIHQAIAKGYAPEIFKHCLTDEDIVHAMADFMREKYLDLGYPAALFAACTTPAEIRGAAEKYRGLLLELRAGKQGNS